MKVYGFTVLSGPSVMSAPLVVCKCVLGKPAGNTKDVPVQIEGQERGTSLTWSRALARALMQAHRQPQGSKQGRLSTTVNSCPALAPTHTLPTAAQNLAVQPGVVYQERGGQLL